MVSDASYTLKLMPQCGVVSDCVCTVIRLKCVSYIKVIMTVLSSLLRQTVHSFLVTLIHIKDKNAEMDTLIHSKCVMFTLIVILS